MTGKQKTPELTSGLVATKGSAKPAADTTSRAAEVEPELPLVEEAVPEPTPEPGSKVTPGAEAGGDERNDAPLNFRVSPAFRREFKTYAAQHDLKLNELLRLAFDAYRKQPNTEKQKGG